MGRAAPTLTQGARIQAERAPRVRNLTPRRSVRAVPLSASASVVNRRARIQAGRAPRARVRNLTPRRTHSRRTRMRHITLNSAATLQPGRSLHGASGAHV